jgi:hypothetical protein
MTTCPGCHRHIEPIAAVRTYHAGCDPYARIENLENVLENLLGALGVVPDAMTLAGVEIEIARAALKTEGREG